MEVAKEIRAVYYVALKNQLFLQCAIKDKSALLYYITFCASNTGYSSGIRTAKRIIKELKTR